MYTCSPKRDYKNFILFLRNEKSEKEVESTPEEKCGNGF